MAIQSAERELQNVTAMLAALFEAFRKSEEGVAPEDSIYQYLMAEGSPDMRVNASAADQVFAWVVPDGRVARLKRLNLSAASTQPERADGFLHLDALSAGLLIEVCDPDNNCIQDFATNDVPITMHAKLGAHAGVDVRTETATGIKFRFAARWTFEEAGEPLKLVGGSRVKVTLRDDVTPTGLVFFNAMVQGTYLR